MIDTIKDQAWIAALVLLFVAVFRDLIKNAISTALRKLGDLIYQRLAGMRVFRWRALRNYGRALLEETERVSIPFRPNRPLILKDVYVSLKVTETHRGLDSRGIGEILRAYSRVVVTGPPGAGKSMLLRHLAASAAKAPRGRRAKGRIPVLLGLHRFGRGEGAKMTVEEHISEALDRHAFPRAEKFVRSMIERGGFLLLLDGLDEVPAQDRAEVAMRLNDFLAKHPRCPALITCRTAVYRGEFEPVSDQSVELEPFQDHQIQSFLDSWSEAMPTGKSPVQLMAALREQPKLLAAARNPLLLTVVAHLYSDNPTYVLPRSRAEFYRHAAAILLDQWQGHLKQNAFEGPEKSTVLNRLAIAMQEGARAAGHDRKTVSREDAVAVAAQVLPAIGRDRGEAVAVLREIVERSGLLLSIDGGARYAFSHLTFQEYFAAEDLLNRPEVLIGEFATEVESWREVVVLWCGLAPDCTEMLKEVNAIDAEVALACVAEARSAEKDAAVEILEPFLEAVITGAASEPTRRSLGAVAADVRPRGNETLERLIAALGTASGEDSRLSIASALATSNREDAAKALVGELDRHPGLSNEVVRLGDLAVPSLEANLDRGDGIAICSCLAQIGTPKAAFALLLPLFAKRRNQTPAAWAFATVLSNPVVVSELSKRLKLSAADRGRSSSDWIWAPFADQPMLAAAVGQAADLIRATRNPEQMIGAPDVRIAAAICAMDSAPLDTTFTSKRASRAFVDAANLVAEASGTHFALRADGRIEVDTESQFLHFMSTDPRPALRARSDSAEVSTYREVLAGTLPPSLRSVRAPRREAPDPEAISGFCEGLVAALDTSPVWQRLMEGLPADLRAGLLSRLGQPLKVNRDTWAAVNAESLFRFQRSARYGMVLTVGVVISLIACFGAFSVLRSHALGSITAVLALVALLSILGSWAWMAIFSSPSSALAGIDPERLAMASVGTVLAPTLVVAEGLDGVLVGEEVGMLATVGFLPGGIWLALEALSGPLPLSAAALLLGSAVLGCIALSASGLRHESAVRTPLVGLFLAESRPAEAGT